MTLTVTAPALLHTERHDKEAKPTMERDELVRHDTPRNRRPSGSSRRITSSEDGRRRSKGDIVKWASIGMSSNTVSPDIGQSFSRVCGCPLAPSVPAGNAACQARAFLA